GEHRDQRHRDDHQHHDGLSEQPDAFGALGAGLGAEAGIDDGRRHADTSSPLVCSSRSCWMVAITVSSWMVPAYSPRAPVTGTDPPSASIASSASCSVDWRLTMSRSGLPRLASEDAEVSSRA